MNDRVATRDGERAATTPEDDPLPDNLSAMDMLRRAQKLAGYDPDLIAERAEALAETGALDELPPLDEGQHHENPERPPDQLALGDEAHEGCEKRGGICDCGDRPCHLDTGLPDPGRKDIGRFSDPKASGAPSTQREAAVAMYPVSGTARRYVLDTIGAARSTGATDEEIEDELHMRHQSASARRNELVSDGWVEDSGRRRQTRSGRDAVVWILSERGMSEWRPAS